MGGLKVCVVRGVIQSVIGLGLFALLLNAVPLNAQTLSEQSLKGMKWRQIGPFRGGRVLAATGVAGDPSTYYFGAVAGGIWKTTDGGASWMPLTDKTPIMSVGAIAIAPSDSNVIYAGTGESCIRGNISYGDGMYKSLDAGRTWTNIGLADTRHIAKVLVDPENPNVVLVAALGHAYGANEMRGVFRSEDGGKSWKKVLYKDEKTGAIDLVFDPHNSHILFAALWQGNRTPWSMTSGGPGSGLYKSNDGGATWKRLEGHGFPEGTLGRIGVAVSGADGNRVYAIIEAQKGGIYLSEDGGDSWHLVNGDHKYTQRAWYFHHIFADPKAVDAVYVLNTTLYRSGDGGRSFSMLRAPHGDHHGLWIDPTNPSWMINSNDGGATISHDGGKTWTTQNNQPTAQFYHVATDTRFPYRVYGAQQDNSTVSIASRSDSGAIDRPDWYDVGGGESGYVVPNPSDPDIVYAGSYDGLITRYNHGNHSRHDISSWPLNPMGAGAAELKHRFQWTAPIAVSPHDPNVLYHGGEGIFMSKDQGRSWTMISPDLTRNDKGKQQSSGGPLTQDNTSVEYYDTVFAIAESPLEKGVIWAGTDDGWVQVTRDGGQHWTNVTPKDLPEWSLISIIDASPHAASTAYVAVDRHRVDDFRPYIYKTADYGKSWMKITAGLPENVYVHAVREDPKRKGLLFAGAEPGVYVSFDDGGHWQSVKANLPTTPIHDLTVKDDDLVAATHGRAFWILDDIGPIRQMIDRTANEEAHLYQPSSAVRFRGPGFRLPGTAAVGANPPSGVVINYFLKAALKDEVTLEISDAKGKVIRKYSSKSTNEEVNPEEEEFGFGARGEKLSGDAGLNRFVWDMRYEAPSRVPRAISWGGRPSGPLAAPGTYHVKLIVGGKTYDTTAEIKKDPRVESSQADLDKQVELAMRIRDHVSAGHDAVNQIRSVRDQLKVLKKRLETDAKSKPIIVAADALGKKMEAIEEKIIQPKSTSNEDPLNYPIQVADQLMALQSSVESADAAPTAQAYVVFDELNGRLEKQLAAWRDVQSKELRELNELILKSNVPVIGLATKSE
ncbi:MAG TPA: glycosyl hydrolase [Candidatus Dormibacteraeota bacterium]|nr:glycosyl hydrolase [Candidatus Dormibacteraeota bacterium]